MAKIECAGEAGTDFMAVLACYESDLIALGVMIAVLLLVAAVIWASS